MATFRPASGLFFGAPQEQPSQAGYRSTKGIALQNTMFQQFPAIKKTVDSEVTLESASRNVKRAAV